MSKKSTWVKVVAISSAVVGAAVGVIAYLKNKSKRLSEELDFDNSLYFDDDTSMMDEEAAYADDAEEAVPAEDAEPAPEAEEAPAEAEDETDK